MQSDTPRPDTAVSGGEALFGALHALERLRDLTPARTNAFDLNDYHGLIRVIAETALERFTPALTPAADRAMPAGEDGQPIPMILHCPRCHVKHVDEPDERTPEWDNPPHRSHLCHACGCIWRPADVPTEGVAAITTRGKADTALATPPASTDAQAGMVEALPEADWQPIETAPRDGTEILAWCVHTNAKYADTVAARSDWQTAVVARWLDHNGGGWTWHGLCGAFTHWRPLPAPPADTGATG